MTQRSRNRFDPPEGPVTAPLKKTSTCSLSVSKPGKEQQLNDSSVYSKCIDALFVVLHRSAGPGAL